MNKEKATQLPNTSDAVTVNQNGEHPRFTARMM